MAVKLELNRSIGGYSTLLDNNGHKVSVVRQRVFILFILSICLVDQSQNLQSKMWIEYNCVACWLRWNEILLQLNLFQTLNTHNFSVGCTSETRPLQLTGSGTIGSLNYPNNYGHRSDCQWLLTSETTTGVSRRPTILTRQTIGERLFETDKLRNLYV